MPFGSLFGADQVWRSLLKDQGSVRLRIERVWTLLGHSSSHCSSGAGAAAGISRGVREEEAGAGKQRQHKAT